MDLFSVATEGENGAEDMRAPSGVGSAVATSSAHVGSDIRNAPGKLKARIDKNASTGFQVVIRWDVSDTAVFGDLPEQNLTEYEVSWEPTYEMVSPQQTQENQMAIDVEPGTTYRIWVRQIIDGKKGAQSDILLFRSAPRSPRNITFHQINDETVEVRFEDPDVETKKYIVHHRKDDAGENEVETETDTKSCLLRGLMPGARYEISVQAQETNRECRFRSAKAWESYILRPRTPKNLQFKRSREGYRLTWEEMVGVTTFRVKWLYGSEKYEGLVENNAYNFTPADLEPGRAYTMKVYALGAHNKESIPVVQDFETVPKTPSDVRVKLEENVALVEFRGDSEAENTYHVIAQPIDGGKNVDKTTGLFYAKLVLEPDQQYSISVYAIYDKLKSLRAEYGELVQTGPKATITNLDFTKVGENLYEAKWEKVPDALKYEVTLTCEGVVFREDETKEEKYLFRVHDVKKANDIEVKPIVKLGGSESARMTIHKQPSSPTNVNWIRCGQRYLLTWDKVDNDVLKYRVEWITGSVAEHETVRSEEYLLTDLKPGESYQVKVCAIGAGKNESDPTVCNIDTAPKKPSDIEVVQVDDGIKVTFDDAEGTADSYEVVAEPTGEAKTHAKVGPQRTKIKCASLTLEPGVQYVVSVYAVYKDQKSPAEKYRELVCSRLAPVEGLNMKRKGETTLEINWLKVQGAKNYAITLRGEEEDTRRYSTRNDSYTIYDIDQTKSYVVEVQAENATGKSVPQEKKIFAATGEVYDVTIFRETEKRCRIRWKKPAGATKYKITLWRNGNKLRTEVVHSLEHCIHDLDWEHSFVIDIRAVSGERESAPRRMNILHVPKNVEMTLVSLDEVEVRCDPVPGATDYRFTVHGGHFCLSSEIEKQRTAQNEIDKSNHSIIVSDPKAKIRLNRDGQFLIVKIRAETRDNSYAETNQTTFRHVARVVQNLIKIKAANIISEDLFVMPQFTPHARHKDLPKSRRRKTESHMFPNPGEVVMVQGGHFCGKTSLCAHYVQKNLPKKMVVFVDVYDFEKDDLFSIHSFLRQAFHETSTKDKADRLTDEELRRLISWMKKHSEDVLFVLDNALNPGHLSQIVSDDSEASGSLIIANLMNKRRRIFPNASVLFTTSWDEQVDERWYSRAFTIKGFHSEEIKLMTARYCEEDPKIPQCVEYLRINPGFCTVILRDLVGRNNDEFLGDWLSSVLYKLMEQYPRDHLRKRKIISILGGRRLGQVYDNSPVESCMALEVEYQTILNCTYAMKEGDFKFRRENDLRPSVHARRWRAIACLLGKDVSVGDFATLLQHEESYKKEELRTKRAIMRNFIKSKKSDLDELEHSNKDLATEWKKHKTKLKLAKRR